MSPRREKIEQMLQADPNDSFLRYSLAMEYRKEGDLEEAIRRFHELIGGEEPFVPAFFMAGQAYVDQGDIAAAREVLRRGIDEARRQGDGHAAGEMSELLQTLGDLGE